MMYPFFRKIRLSVGTDLVSVRKRKKLLFEAADRHKVCPYVGHVFYGTTTGEIKSQFLSQKILPFSMAKRLTCGSKNRPIGHFAGYDTSVIPINTGIADVSTF